jgi:hypothetical protein
MINIKKSMLVIVFSILLLLILLGKTTPADNPIRPSELTINVSNNSPNVRDTVTVTLSEIPYETGNPEAYVDFGADVYYGTKAEKENNIPGAVDYILEGWTATGSTNDGNKYYATFSFIPDKQGLITIDVNAHRRYDVTFAYTELRSYESSISPPLGADGNMTSIILVLLGSIILIVIVAVIIFLVKRKKKDVPIKSISIEKQNDTLSGIQMEIRDKPSVRMQIKEIKKQEKKSTSFCPNCGIKIEGISRFCPECGSEL